MAIPILLMAVLLFSVEIDFPMSKNMRFGSISSVVYGFIHVFVMLK